MMFEEFDPQITLEQNKFNDLHEPHAWQNTVIDRNSQCHLSMVRLSTIWRILIEDIEQNKTPVQNHKSSFVSSRLCRQIKNNDCSVDLKRLLFEAIDNDNPFLTELENGVKERKQIKNLLAKMINNRNLNLNSINDLELQEIDEELLWLMQEYYRISSLPLLTENDTNRMLLILELAQFDPELDNFINKIDAAIAEESGLIETNFLEENSSTKKFKEVFIKYLEQRLSNE